MQRLILWSGVAGLTACLVKPTFVSILPDYDYVDGCAQVVLQGHHLGTAATAKIGDIELALTPWEDAEGTPEHASDVGFKYTAEIPPSPESGFFDVTLTVDGEDLVIDDGFYYRACPGSFAVDAYAMPGSDTTYTPTVNVGDAISFQGCGLSDQVKVQFLAVGAAPTARALPPPTTGTTPTDTSDTGGTGGTTTGTLPTGDTGGGTTTTVPPDTGAPPDTSVPPDTGLPPDTSVPPDTGAPPDTGTPPDTGAPPTGTQASPCDVPLTLVSEVDLVSDCRTAQVHADIPQLDPGQYYVRLVHSDGTVYEGGVYPDTADTAGDGGNLCAPISFVIGGAK